jgi:UDP-N-acetylmuramoylalanine--D-glutamate ligase
MHLAGKNIVVVGLGRTGLALARFLTQAHADVMVTDTADETALGNPVQQIKELGVKTELGRHRNDTFENADLIVISPGVPHTIEPEPRSSAYDRTRYQSPKPRYSDHR